MFRRSVLSRRPRRRLSLLSAIVLAVAALPALPPFVGTARAASVTLAADADATVAEASPETNFGSEPTLLVDGWPDDIEAYLRFPAAPSSDTVTRATLRLFVVDRTKDAPPVHPVTTSWSESGITWEKRPTLAAPPLDDLGAVGADEWVEYDVTGTVVSGSPVAFVLRPDSGDGIDFNSRNASGNQPELVIETSASASTSTSIFSTSTTATTTVPGSTHLFGPSADARVEEHHPETNYGSDDRIGNQAEPDPRTHSYLRFEVTGLGAVVRRATVRLLITGSGDGPSVQPTDGSWTESGVTWSNRPAPTGDAVGLFGGVSRGWVELDITPLVAGNGPVNLLLSGGSADSVQIRSREGDPEDRPQLVVETASSTTTTSPTTTTTAAPTTTTTTTTAPTTTTTTAPTTTTTRPAAECDDSWDDADKIGELPSGRGEMSGLVASSAHPGWGWGVRDSANPASLYSFRIGSDDRLTSDEFPVPGAMNSDWEDVAYTRTSTGAGHLWILENVGNLHTGNRRIYQVLEPDPAAPGATELIAQYEWAYPDVQFNSEILFVFDGDLAVIAKASPSRVYRFFEPLKPGVVNRPTFIGTLPTGSNLSVASMSPDHRFLAVASHSRLYVYENAGDLTDLADLITGDPVFSERLPSDNRESGGFFPHGSCDIVLVAESKNVWRSSQ